MPFVSPVQNTRFGGRKLDSQVMTRRVNWLNSIREWQQDFLGSLDAREFVDCVTDELFGKGVFVFTPYGEVMRLPKVALLLVSLLLLFTPFGEVMRLSEAALLRLCPVLLSCMHACMCRHW